MYQITQETLENAFKPFDIVTDEYGNVGFIREVNVNSSQNIGNQISYAVEWLVGNQTTTAWWDNNELKKHCNVMIKIAENMCHAFGGNESYVSKLFSLK